MSNWKKWSKYGFGSMINARYFADEDDEAGSEGGGGGGSDETGGGAGATSTKVGTDEAIASAKEFNITNYIDKDGNFLEDWQSGLLDEKQRDQGIYSRLKDIKGLLGIVGSQEKTLSKKGVVPIDENSSDEEIALYRESMNVPKTPEEYTLPKELTEGLEDYYSQPLVQEATKVLHDIHLTQKQYEAVMALDAKRLKAFEEEGELATLQNETDAEAQIDKLFGSKKEAKIRCANLAINEVTKDWSPEEKLALFGTNDEPAGINSPEFASLKPLFLKFMSDFGSYFDEDGGIITAQLADPETLDDQIGKLTEKLTPELQRTNRKEYNRLLTERDQLYKKRYPNKNA